MREYKTVEYPARTGEVLVAIHCDICRKVFKNNFRGVDAHETTVSLREGYSFPDGRSVTEISFDVCPSCFKEKVIPWFRSMGATETITEEED